VAVASSKATASEQQPSTSTPRRAQKPPSLVNRLVVPSGTKGTILYSAGAQVPKKFVEDPLTRIVDVTQRFPLKSGHDEIPFSTGFHEPVQAALRASPKYTGLLTQVSKLIAGGNKRQGEKGYKRIILKSKHGLSRSLGLAELISKDLSLPDAVHLNAAIELRHRKWHLCPGGLCALEEELHSGASQLASATGTKPSREGKSAETAAKATLKNAKTAKTTRNKPSTHHA
jgi:hypothetical protein